MLTDLFYPGGPVSINRPISSSSDSPLWALNVHMCRLLSSSKVTSSTYKNHTKSIQYNTVKGHTKCSWLWFTEHFKKVLCEGQTCQVTEHNCCQ